LGRFAQLLKIPNLRKRIMEFRNQHLHSGFGLLWSPERSESMPVFYVLRSSEVSVEMMAWITRLDVQNMDYRDQDEPDWISKESILEAENGKRYRVQKQLGFWVISEIEELK
jgi:hypothetical protein